MRELIGRFLQPLLWGVWLALWAGLATGAQLVKVVHSEFDPREYRALRFASGLEVLLIREQGPERWVLSVAAGRRDDPAHTPDLSRLAALSFTSSPELRYWGAEVGESYTYFERTGGGIEPAAAVAAILRGDAPAPKNIAEGQQRLATLMRSPRQVSASERRDDVLRTVASKPVAALGPSASLVQLEHVKPELEAFIREFYTPNHARLVVRTSASLDRLEKHLGDVLADLGKVEKSSSENAAAIPWQDQEFPVAVDAITDAPPELQFSFFLPEAATPDTRKGLALISYLLQHQGPGSLAALLADLGWALGIQTQWYAKGENASEYRVTIALTDLGLKAHEQIGALLMYQLEQIRLHGLESWRYQELARSARYDFTYHQWRNPRDLRRLVTRMHAVDVERVLSSPYELGDFKEKRNRELLAQLRVENLAVMRSYRGGDLDARTLDTRTPYQLREALEIYPDIKLSVKRKLTLPEANNFVPQRLAMKESQLLAGGGGAGVSVLADTDKVRAWYSRPESTRMPLASVYLRLIYNGPNASADSAARALVWSRLYADALNNALFDARMAGADYRVQAHPLGLDVQVTGYNSQMGLMLNRMGQIYSDAWPLLQNWESARDRVLQALAGAADGLLHPIYYDPLLQWHYRPAWSGDSLRQALVALDAQSLKTAPPVGRVEALMVGDMYRQEAQRLEALAEHYFLSDNAPEAQPAGLVVGDQSGLLAVARDQRLRVYLQAPGDGERDRVFTLALARLLDGELLSVESGSERSSVALQAHYYPIAGRPGLIFTLAPDVEVEDVLKAVQSRLDEPDIGGQLQGIKASLGRSLEGRQSVDTWLDESLWRSVRQAYRGDERTAVAALNSASIERFAKRLIGQKAIDISTMPSFEAYGEAHKIIEAGYRLP
ncbi:insulinase family protein [Gilvimarinus xylanilyticus]|uniref:Protease 3 n=1 Tax=Gilvimarinus xylanilyticus TaxID=2944139 RepID=A0A9X2HUL4_9GAMM|nr:insulinase family protein [Gilvimarinus xylanilyticus]MCP8898758.1 insulinase family protein [Gilvimarinus xylanilyticus]